MENKNFIINESERERILQKHQDATKNLYLNIISEQNNNKGEYVIRGSVYFLENSTNKTKPEVKLFKGATFKKIPNKERLVANTKYQYVDSLNHKVVKSADDYTTVSRDNERVYTFTGTITYFCQSGKFVTDKSKNQYFDEEGELVKRLKTVCGFKGDAKPEEKKEIQTPNYTSKNDQELKSDTNSMEPIILVKRTKFFWNDKGGYSFRDSGEKPPKTEVNSGKWRWFSCKTKKFKFGDKGIYENSQLSYALLKSNDLCRNFLKGTQTKSTGSSGTQTKSTGSSGSSKQGLVKPTDEVITKLINMVK